MKINQTKMHIMDVATGLILDQGIQNTSLSAIAAAAGISKGTLYYHFPSKNDLIFSITEVHIGTYADELSKLLTTMQPIAGVAEMIQAFYDIFLQATFRSKLHIYLINEAISGNQALRDRIVEIYHLWKKKIKAEMLKLAPPEISDINIIGELLLASLDGWIIQSILGVSPLSIEESAAFFARELENP